MKHSWLLVCLSFSMGCAVNQGCEANQGWSSWEEDSVANVLILDPDDKFSDEQRDMIDQVLNEWMEATDEHITFTYVPTKGYRNLIVIRSDALANIQEERDCSAVTDWVPWENGGGITLPYDAPLDGFRLLVLHEVGHALGLGHEFQDKEAIMFPASQERQNITCTDVEAFCDSNDCESYKLTVCQ